jgi:hypothetical protein
MILLAAVFAEERRIHELDPFDINNTGLLSMRELDAVADTVWAPKALCSPSSDR